MNVIHNLWRKNTFLWEFIENHWYLSSHTQRDNEFVHLQLPYKEQYHGDLPNLQSNKICFKFTRIMEDFTPIWKCHPSFTFPIDAGEPVKDCTVLIKLVPDCISDFTVSSFIAVACIVSTFFLCDVKSLTHETGLHFLMSTYIMLNIFLSFIVCMIYVCDARALFFKFVMKFSWSYVPDLS